MPWVIRDTANKIIGEAPLESATFNESVLATDLDYVAYKLADKKIEKVKLLKGLRDETANGGVVHTIASTAHTFQTDPSSTRLINGSLAVKERGNTTFFPLNWIDAANVSVSVTDTDLVSVFDLCGRLTEAAYTNYTTHRTAIEEATDQAELDLVDITAGWPTTPYTG